MTAYRTERHPAGWRVVDVQSGDVVSHHPANAAGAQQAAAAAAALNRQHGPGSELRAWRRSHGLTLKQLAGVLGIGWVTLQRWETGGQSVPPYLHLALRQLESDAAPPRPSKETVMNDIRLLEQNQRGPCPIEGCEDVAVWQIPNGTRFCRS